MPRYSQSLMEKVHKAFIAYLVITYGEDKVLYDKHWLRFKKEILKEMRKK